MKMLCIKISKCFTHPFKEYKPTNHLNAYNNTLMGFPQRVKAQQACSVVLATSFVDRQNGLCGIFSPLGVPICIHVQRFFLTKKNNKGHPIKPSCVRIALQSDIT